MGDIKKREVLICRGTGCNSLNAKMVTEELKNLIKEHKIEKSIQIKETGCHGFCQIGPTFIILPDNTLYVQLKPENVRELVEEHFINDKVVKSLLYKDPKTNLIIENKDEVQFFSEQVGRITTKNCGVIDPESIDEYLEIGGYESLKKCLEMNPDDIIEEVKKSRLRGRGGGGFPTGMKWSFIKSANGSPKYLICNADEGDPGAFMDRTVLESDPHAVIEGMLIGAIAVGAMEGFIYARAEYPLAIKRFSIALKQAKERGFIGKNILGKGLDFDITLKQGAGAFVCGEETALMRSVEGNRGNPTPRPPFPANSGLWGKPTNINNVKTWATIPKIFEMGADAYSAIGTEDASGTAIICCSGKINNSGLIEVPMGTSIRKLIFDIGGGIPDGKKFKAIQVGGPSGGCIPAKFLDTQMDYKNLTALGAIMGSGGFIVLDEDTCMVELAHFFISFTQKESCGKCTPCRVGTRKMLKILTKISNGKGEMKDIENLIRIGNVIKKGSLCGLGQTAPNPVLTTIKYFREEYEAHIKGSCPAKVCEALIKYEINKEKCNGCDLCAKNCSVNAISGEKKKPHEIDSIICVRCGLCLSSCPKDAIYKTTKPISP